MKCPHCGSTDIEPGDRFCGDCRHPLSAEGAPSEPSLRSADRKEGLVQCPHCGSMDIEPGDRFCGDCRHPLSVEAVPSEPSLRCIACKAELQPGDKFCNECGQSQTAASASKTPEKRENPAWTWLKALPGRLSPARWHVITGRTWLAGGLVLVVVIALVFGALTKMKGPETPATPPSASKSAQPEDSSLIASLFGFVSGLWHRNGGVPLDNNATRKEGVKSPGPGPADNNTRTGGPISESAKIVLSDTFDRANADRCDLGSTDQGLGGSGKHYYLPLFAGKAGTQANPIGANIVAKGLYNNGLDFGGVQITAAAGACSDMSVKGENAGRDINIRVDLLSPSDHFGNTTQGGPFFRSRAVSSGDDIIGGDSGGFWVALYSTGEVKVIGFGPLKTVATSGRPASFDNRIYHTLEVAVQGDNLQVALDSRLLTFKQNEALSTNVLLPAAMGKNDGAVGIAFGAMDNRGEAGGQRADSLVIRTFHSLHDLPVQNHFAGKPSS